MLQRELRIERSLTYFGTFQKNHQNEKDSLGQRYVNPLVGLDSVVIEGDNQAILLSFLFFTF